MHLNSKGLICCSKYKIRLTAVYSLCQKWPKNGPNLLTLANTLLISDLISVRIRKDLFVSNSSFSFKNRFDNCFVFLRKNGQKLLRLCLCAELCLEFYSFFLQTSAPIFECAFNQAYTVYNLFSQKLCYFIVRCIFLCIKM